MAKTHGMEKLRDVSRHCARVPASVTVLPFQVEGLPSFTARCVAATALDTDAEVEKIGASLARLSRLYAQVQSAAKKGQRGKLMHCFKAIAAEGAELDEPTLVRAAIQANLAHGGGTPAARAATMARLLRLLRTINDDPE